MTRLQILEAAIGIALGCPFGHMAGAEFPEAQIANRQIRVKFYLPDAAHGFYRSTRFDWSGVIESLEYQGHNYYGPWFTKLDPAVRDFEYRDRDIVAGARSATVGPAEEFQTPVGFDTAKPGQTFLKVGVGMLRKPDDSAYSAFKTYEIADSGKWSVHTSPDAVEFIQELADSASGFGYVYSKTIRLASGKPEMTMEDRLRNTGSRPIQTRVYNHNFLVLDHAAPGAGYAIIVPFEIRTARPPDPQFAQIHGHRIEYVKTLEGQDRVAFPIEGFSADVKDYDIRVENRGLGAGVRVTADRPLASVSLWSIRSVLAVEPFIAVSAEPGKEFTWKYVYSYYSLPKSK